MTADQITAEQISFTPIATTWSLVLTLIADGDYGI